MDEFWRKSLATLNVKNLPDRLYKRLQARAKRQHRSVAQEVTHILSAALDQPEPLSILELQGLGKEVWADVDATDYSGFAPARRCADRA